MISQQDTGYKAARFSVRLFMSFAVISCLYALLTGKYNGDFFGMPVELPAWLLLVNLLFSLLPFIATWYIYRAFKKRAPRKTITIPSVFFKAFILVLMIWNIAVTLIFGVGIMGNPMYEAPPVITPLIQLLNKFNYIYIGMLYILVSDKKDRMQFLVVILLIMLAYLRQGLGIFLYLGLCFLLKYYDEAIVFVKKKFAVFLVIICLFPISISVLYEVRAALRNDLSYAEEPLSSSAIIFGRFVGRVSSFANSAMIIQEAPYFAYNSLLLDNYYYPKQALAGIIGVKYMPKPIPENLLINIYGGDSENVSYMVGVPGGWYIALLKPISSMVVNIITILVCIYLTFYFMRLLKFRLSNELAFILVLYPLISGVASEFSILMFSVFTFAFFFLVADFVLQIGNQKRSRQLNDATN